MLMQVGIRFNALAISEMTGVRMFKNIYVSSIVVLVLLYLLVSPRIIVAGLWGFIWALFGASNQLLAGVTLLVTTLWLTKVKKPNLFTVIPAVFMLVTTIVALGYVAYATLFIAVTRSGNVAYGSGITGVIAIILTALSIVLAYDGGKAYRAIASGRPTATIASSGSSPSVRATTVSDAKTSTGRTMS
jgi:carbon starvation protein